LVKLGQGLIGEENSYLLGTLFVAKLNQAAQSRQNISADQRSPYFLYIDEFQNFITPSMSSILSGARKYGLGLILAHQDLDQLARRDAELANSVISNPSIRVCFRCGDKDAAKLADGFSYFDSTDLQNLGVGQAIARVGLKDHDFNFTFSRLTRPDSKTVEDKQKAIMDHCRSTYAIHQSEVEETLRDVLQSQPTQNKTEKLKVKKRQEIQQPIIESYTPIESVESKVNLKAEAQQFISKETEKEKQREHRFIQEFIKSVAEARNFKAIFEEPINDNTGKVDVGLLRNDLKIACEISVTNTPEYELQNIQKCLRGGFPIVFMISNEPKHLNTIKNLAISSIDPSLHNRIYFVSKDEFVHQLDLFLAQYIQPTETRARGYRVKVKYSGTSDNSTVEKNLKDVVLSTLRKKENPE
jgi:hypothetical protein